jgi:UDP-4-amino-4,6-dideoxy-N-acetyl-beta-L-altrosamine transaminase
MAGQRWASEIAGDHLLMLPYGRQQIDDDDIQAVIETLKSDFLTTGPCVEKFEQALCKATGAKYAVACANGTAALHLACLAIDLKADECAIVPSITFLATANAVRYCGADVMFCDVDAETGVMTPDTFEEALSKAKEQQLNIRAVLPVHLAGRPVDLAGIKKIAEQHQIKIITDSCHALGGQYESRPIGSGHFEDLSAFSFHPVKTITTGEGGAITTNDKAMAQKIREIRHHNMTRNPDSNAWEYEMKSPGYNYRITDIQCALGLSQLQKLESFVQRRNALVSIYNEHLGDISKHIKTHQIPPGDQITSWHLYAARIDFEKLGISRQTVMTQLKERGIGTQVHYIPVHTQPYYQNLYGELSLPGADHYYQETLSLPLFPAMTEKDVHFVNQALKKIVTA